MERYHSYQDLKVHEKEGWDYEIHARPGQSGILVMAPHGGGIEPGTTEIADAVAGKDHAYYSFDGRKKKGNTSLHITSRHFDEPIGTSLAEKSEMVIAIHGCQGKEEVVYVGGLDYVTREEIRQALTSAGFSVRETPRFPGKNARNICNRCHTRKGVQLEVSYGLRCRMFDDLSRILREGTTLVFNHFVSALRQALSRSS